MARASSQEAQPKAEPNLASDADLATRIDQFSKDVQCGLSRAHYLCRLIQDWRFGTLEQIDRATVVDSMMTSVTPLLEHYRAAAETFPTVSHFVKAVADRTSAHEEALSFARKVQIVFVGWQVSSDLPEMADVIVRHWQPIRDGLLKIKRPDLEDLLNRITVESAKAIGSQHLNRDPDELPQYVTLDRMAALVSKSKSTLEKRKTRKINPLPLPDVDGGGGKADEWIYAKVRPWLEQEFGKKLPERLPTNLRVSDRI